ncbi:MAG: protein of unknown function transrane [Acidobacteria bacterium]|nr:protein of unknown function transrane [Acidobacteriota bacterium]
MPDPGPAARGGAPVRPLTALKALATIALWGGSFVATKVALRELSPLAIIVARFGLGLAVLLALLAWRRQARLADRADLAWLALLGLIGVTLHQLLQSFGLLTTTATNSGWMVALIPVFTAVLARVALGERLGPVKVLGLAVASLGALVVVARGLDLRGVVGARSPGDALMLLSAANMALFTTWSKRVITRYPPVVTMAHVMAFGWLASLPLLAVGDGWHGFHALSPAGWWSLVFLGVGCSGIAYAFWYDALAEIDASALSSFQYFQPVVTLVVANRLLGEPITPAVAGGGAAILAGVWLVTRRP